MMSETPIEQPQETSIFRKNIPRSTFGTEIILDELTPTCHENLNALEKGIFMAFEILGFDKPERITELWFGQEEIDEENLEIIGHTANKAMTRIFGRIILRTKTALTTIKENSDNLADTKNIKDIHNIVELAKIASETIPTDETSLARVHQAQIKLVFMHIINSIKREYNKPKVAAIARNLIEDVKEACKRLNGLMEEVEFNPYGNEFELATENTSSLPKRERKKWKKGFRLNIFADTERQPILYIDEEGKSEESVLLKCLSKNTDHLASGILDVERLRIEFPSNTLEQMSQEERDEALKIIAHIIQNIIGTNLIAKQGNDNYRTGESGTNDSSTPNDIKRIKFTTTYRPNIRPKTVIRIAEEIRTIATTSSVIRSLKPQTIILPRRRGFFKQTLYREIISKRKDIGKLETELENIHRKKKPEIKERIQSLKKELSDIEKTLDLMEQITSVIPEEYDVEITDEKIQLIGKEQTNRLNGVPLEIQIVEHRPWGTESKDHDEYLANKNRKIAEEFGLSERHPKSEEYITKLTDYIKYLSKLILAENHDHELDYTKRTEEGAEIKKRRMTTHAKILLSALLASESAEGAITTAIAKIGREIKDAILKTLEEETIETRLKGNHHRYNTALGWATAP